MLDRCGQRQHHQVVLAHIEFAQCASLAKHLFGEAPVRDARLVAGVVDERHAMHGARDVLERFDEAVNGGCALRHEDSPLEEHGRSRHGAGGAVRRVRGILAGST
ncbi:hypothetical protein LXE92_33450 [Burkholderia contaminans]|nr:hypothetical protein [Burkholderia contaminans]WFN15117.1 hypothetical protein LXE92_33450 [Burkholderia contaminans]